MQPSTFNSRHAWRATCASGLDLLAQQTLEPLSAMRQATEEALCPDVLMILVPCGGQPGSARALPHAATCAAAFDHLAVAIPLRALLDPVQAAGDSLAVQDLQLYCRALQARVQGAPVGTPVCHQALVAMQALQPQVLYRGGAAAQGEMPQVRLQAAAAVLAATGQAR